MTHKTYDIKLFYIIHMVYNFLMSKTLEQTCNSLSLFKMQYHIGISQSPQNKLANV